MEGLGKGDKGEDRERDTETQSPNNGDWAVLLLVPPRGQHSGRLQSPNSGVEEEESRKASCRKRHVNLEHAVW